MAKQQIGILFPGQMGISVAASAQNSGHAVHWTSEGRSSKTKDRASEHNLSDTGTLQALCEASEILVCVCPPHAAEEVAARVRAHAFRGKYLDANAIAPQRSIRIGQAMEAAGISFIDGGIVGGPAWEPGQTWLYLSGECAGEVAGCFSAGPLETTVVGSEIGKASAIKMCYAAYTKGTTALLSAILATAEQLGVRQELETQWSRDWPELPEQARRRARRVTAKAWRFAGEMGEISATFQQAGVPGGFHAAAKEIYSRIAHFKGAPTEPALEDVLRALSRTSDSNSD
ncbi:DUF1932 domain-containing protein [Candidatus Eisenbacteria bacterium]|uniref:DUF1932 domain-containing protein n=1 Tax=Eiseniibacteriota bacterium TaxID=2212470 RepID=A0ABV6YLA0_UNCEI